MICRHSPDMKFDAYGRARYKATSMCTAQCDSTKPAYPLFALSLSFSRYCGRPPFIVVSAT